MMVESTKLECKDLLSYLQELPPSILTSLYQHPAACLTVFRELPELSQQYVMRVLFLSQALPVAMVSSWAAVDAQSQKLHEVATGKLQDLRIWQSTGLTGGQRGVMLSPAFKANLSTLICGGGMQWAPVHTGAAASKHSRDTEFLSTYADQQWEIVLNYMVGGGSDDVPRDVVEILQCAGLMSNEGVQSSITTTGFQFLLMDRQSQVWYFLLQYLNSVEARRMSLTECLTFLFQLGFLTFGKDYSTESMTDSQLLFLQHLRQFGLVYKRKRSSKRYYPTKLAVNLISGMHSEATSSLTTGYIILETNFRVVAYTDSHLQIDILALFCQLQYRFANMVIGTITRESVHQALMHGITADQVLSFIRLHAHPEMLRNRPLIPPTVSDQIRLWERERDRLEFSEGVLYSEFMSASDFETVKQYAKDLGVLLWSNPAKRLMVVSNNGHDEVKRFWRRQKNP